MLATLKRALRRVPGLYPLLHGLYLWGYVRFAEPRVYARHRLVRAAREMAAVIGEEKLAGGLFTEAGEYFLRMPDGIFLYYNHSDPQCAPGDGQGMEFRDAATLPDLERFIDRALSDEAVYLDVGANNGYFYCLKVARRYPDCRIHAIEPDASSLNVLEKNIAFNGANNISVACVALAAFSGTGSMPARAGASGYLLGETDRAAEAVEVRVSTLDDYVRDQGIGRLDLIKVDIEGGEYGFLVGGKSTLQRCRPVLVLELNDDLLRRSRASAEEVQSLLRDLDYRGYRIAGSNDALFVPREKTAILSEDDETWLNPLA